MNSVPSAPTPANDPSIAVLIPCFNEEQTIGDVVNSFRGVLPRARIYVYDNGSTDNTLAAAAAAGAAVGQEVRKGKGNVIRRMFGDIDADIYLMVDGDDTYCAADAPLLIQCLRDNGLDLVNGRREDQHPDAYRRGHRVGNLLFNRIIQLLFGAGFNDVFSGYKALSRRFVKSFPALSREFEIETELAVHTLTLRLPFAELPTVYSERPAGSTSKLRSYRDGMRILATIVVLVKQERPLLFYSAIGAGFALASIVLFIPVLQEYLLTGLVPRFPTAILSTGLMLSAMLSVANGLILSAVSRGRWEVKRMMYLNTGRRG